ncbi:MAG: type II CRISPR RNA-guided endonuclease Cas9 [Tabrizicola sp.]
MCNRAIRDNERRNDRWRAELQAEGLLAEGARIGDRFLRMRLWEELGKSPADRLCPYSGRPIALHQLHSDEVEIDHILPFADTFDDSPANKTLCFREANRIKGKRAPGEAWSGEELAAIVARTKHLPDNKAWRFRPDAMKKWQKSRSFEDCQLNATSYLARVVRAYAEALFPKTDDDGKRRSHVWVLPGRMTAMLRQRWGLNLGDHNRKSRDDHRHHAIDAAVVGVIDRRMIQILQGLARKMGAEHLDRVLPAPPEPFAGFRDAVLRAVEKVNVSHRAQHGSANPSDPSQTSGRLHEDTVYGLVRDLPENQADLSIGNVVVRKPVLGLTEKEIGQVRDVRLRLSLEEATRAARDRSLPEAERKKRLTEALQTWVDNTGHRRLRILKPEAAVRPVHDRQGLPYKWLVPGENAFMDILEGPDGTWFQHTTDIWAANSGGAKPWNLLHPQARFIMRVHKNDTLQLFDWDDQNDCVVEGSNTIKRIVRLSPSNSVIYLVKINEAGDFQKRHNDPDDPFRWDFANIGKLKLRRARRVRIDELGRVHTIPHGKI